MSLSLVGTKEACVPTWKFSETFPAGSEIVDLTLPVTLDCSLSAGEATFVLRFGNVGYIQDKAGNNLATQELTTATKKYSYMSTTEAAALSSAGSAFSAVSFVSLALAVGMCMFQSTAVGSFWSFVNMLQILSYLPIIDCDLPYNFEILLTQYLTVSQVTIPFNMLPDWVPNPLTYIGDFATDVLNDRYSLCGYSAASFIYNFGSQLFTWILIFFFYLLLRVLTCVFPRPR